MRSSVALGSIVVRVDGSADSDHAVRWAATCAAAHRRPLTIVHGAAVPECLIAGFPVDMEEADMGLVRTGRTVTDQAVNLARIVGRDVTERLLGSVSRSVVKHACCTVAVVGSAQT